jgi:BirA family biotin operon repressor/biotin-[acetyl-CoA-carboxylase] ligase
VTKSLSWPAGYAHLHFESIDSTNEEARRLAAAGELGPVWIDAREQTAGRGRRGRSWFSPHGNLAATLLVRPVRPASEWAQLSFVAALAASDAVSGFVTAPVALKWPNDLMIEGRKIAGILLESASTGQVAAWLAIGIGINLSQHPSDSEIPAISIAGLGAKAPSPHEALTALATDFARWYEVWMATGFERIRDAWLARAAGLGTRIRARLHNEEIWGTFEGIDQTGALILREAMGRVRTIAAGDVFFG